MFKYTPIVLAFSVSVSQAATTNQELLDLQAQLANESNTATQETDATGQALIALVKAGNATPDQVTAILKRAKNATTNAQNSSSDQASYDRLQTFIDKALQASKGNDPELAKQFINRAQRTTLNLQRTAQQRERIATYQAILRQRCGN